MTVTTPAVGGIATLPAGNTFVSVNTATGTITSKTPTVAATPASGAKKNPYGIGTYMRLYPGLDAMATNGLRYGAGTEIRMNSPTPALGTGAVATGGASAYTFGNTLYRPPRLRLRRRGQLGLWCAPVGRRRDLAVRRRRDHQPELVQLRRAERRRRPVHHPERLAIPFYWMAVAGNEYDSNKIVYISPKLFGVEAGFSYAPAAGNLYASCSVPGSNCSTLSSSSVVSDAARYTDLYQAGLRYLNDVGPVNLRVYGVYVGSGTVSYTGPAPKYGSVAGFFDNISVFNAGAAATFAGFTLGANWIGGAMNGQFVPKPAGGANLNATTVGLQYVTGALTLGVTGAVADSQGAIGLVGQTQQHEQEISFGGRYVVAPGLAVSADYIYQQRRQNGYNFVTGAVGNDYNAIHGQSVLLGVAVNW